MNISVAHMFAAGIVPGVVLATILVANNMLLSAWVSNAIRRPRAHHRGSIASGAAGLPALRHQW